MKRKRELSAATRPRLARADLIGARDDEGVRLWAGALGVLEVDFANAHATAEADAANAANREALSRKRAQSRSGGPGVRDPDGAVPAHVLEQRLEAPTNRRSRVCCTQEPLFRLEMPWKWNRAVAH